MYQIFKRENVGCYNWGLVKGKTQTIYPWGSEEGTPEPDTWFHDILREDGTPFSVEEVKLIKSVTARKAIFTVRSCAPMDQDAGTGPPKMFVALVELCTSRGLSSSGPGTFLLGLAIL